MVAPPFSSVCRLNVWLVCRCDEKCWMGEKANEFNGCFSHSLAQSSILDWMESISVRFFAPLFAFIYIITLVFICISQLSIELHLLINGGCCCFIRECYIECYLCREFIIAHIKRKRPCVGFWRNAIFGLHLMWKHLFRFCFFFAWYHTIAVWQCLISF